MDLFFLGTAALYAATSAAFGAYLVVRRESVLRVARLGLVAALAVHLGFIGFQCTRGMNPLRDIHGALGLSGWLLAAGFLLTTLRSRFALIGALVTPLALALVVASRLTPATAATATAAKGMVLLGRVHIALSATGVAIFGIAAAVAMLYLFQEAALKRKRVGALYRRAPPLASLDAAGRRLIMIGFPIYTLAVVTGLVWTTRNPSGGFRFEHAIAALTWVIFAGLIAARVSVGLRGRSAATLTVLGFVSTVVVLLIYMFRRLVGG